MFVFFNGTLGYRYWNDVKLFFNKASSISGYICTYQFQIIIFVSISTTTISCSGVLPVQIESVETVISQQLCWSEGSIQYVSSNTITFVQKMWTYAQ